MKPMKDTDFDKIFAGKFARFAGKTYREEDWAELSHHLDAYGRRRRWMLPFMLPLFLLLAGGNVFWWYQWREATLHNKSSDNHTLIIQTDTIVRTTTVFRFDTIYQAVTHVFPYRAERSNQPPTTPENPVSFPAYSRISTHSTTQQPRATDAQTTAGAISDPAEINKNTVDKTMNADANQQAVVPLAGGQEEPPGIADTASNSPHREISGAESKVIDKDTVQLSPTPEPVKKAGSPAFYVARPRLGILAGWGSPSLPGKLSGSILKVGLSADIEVARNFRLGMSVSFDPASIKSSETAALGDNTNIPDPGQDFTLKYWESSGLSAISYAMYLAYSLPAGKTWSPRIGVGAQAATFFPYDVEFEFKNQFNNLELHLPVQSSTVTRWQGLLISVGLDAHLNRHITLGLEGYLLRRFDKKPTIMDNQVGLKTNLYYIF